MLSLFKCVTISDNISNNGPMLVQCMLIARLSNIGPKLVQHWQAGLLLDIGPTSGYGLLTYVCLLAGRIHRPSTKEVMVWLLPMLRQQWPNVGIPSNILAPLPILVQYEDAFCDIQFFIEFF